MCIKILVFVCICVIISLKKNKKLYIYIKSQGQARFLYWFRRAFRWGNLKEAVILALFIRYEELSGEDLHQNYLHFLICLLEHSRIKWMIQYFRTFLLLSSLHETLANKYYCFILQVFKAWKSVLWAPIAIWQISLRFLMKTHTFKESNRVCS